MNIRPISSLKRAEKDSGVMAKDFDGSDSDQANIELKKQKSGKRILKGETSRGKKLKAVEKKHKKRKGKLLEKGENSKIRKKNHESKNDEEVLESTTNKQKRDEWFGLWTRSSPSQLFSCIRLLKDNQREAVKRMGFGKLLGFKVDGIPAKIAHYVVDSFKPEKMEIKLPCGKIKVDAEAIHQLLGIPCDGIALDSLPRLDPKDESVIEWRSRYPSRFVAPTQLVKNIEEAEDKDTFNFRMDFMMLFITVMVNCHKQGRLKETILESITGETDFSQINWCAYVVDILKSCKDGWRRCDHRSPFVGPLAILTLLYVDNVECKGLENEKNVNAISFWNMEKLRRREKLEIKSGGFGKGRFKVLPLNTYNPCEREVAMLGCDNIMAKISDLEKLLDVTLKNKRKIESAIGKMYLAQPDNKDVLRIKARFEYMLEDKPKWPTRSTEDIKEASNQIDIVVGSLNDEEKANQQNKNEERNEKVLHRGGNANDATGEQGINETLVVANFILELSQLRKGNACGVEGGDEVQANVAGENLDVKNILTGLDKVTDEVANTSGEEGLENTGSLEMETGLGRGEPETMKVDDALETTGKDEKSGEEGLENIRGLEIEADSGVGTYKECIQHETLKVDALWTTE